MTRFIWRWLGVVLWLACGVGSAGCAAVTQRGLPTRAATPVASATVPLRPSPTLTPTVTLTPSPSPSATPRPLPTLSQGGQVTPFTVPWPTATFTPVVGPTLSAPDYAPVHIRAPGPESKVTSPIALHFQVRVNGVRVMHIELLGEDGRLLYRKVERFRRGAQGWRGYDLEVPFEIRAESEWGRLQIYLRDAQDLPLFQQAVPLVLLRQGRQDLIPIETWEAPIIIRSPGEGMQVQGGALTVRGFAKAPTGLVEVLVVGDDGRIWYTRAASVTESDAQGYGAFETTIPYQVERVRQVFIIVQAYGERVPGIMYLNRVMAYLAP